MVRTYTVGLLILACSVASCQTTQKADNFSNLSVAAGWDGVKPCTGGQKVYYPSPKFKITGIPQSTKYLEFSLDHVDAGIDHGTDRIAYTGGEEVRPGAFEYMGPCPQFSGVYEWKVVALDSTQNLSLGEGKLTLNFPVDSQARSGWGYVKREPASGELRAGERVLVDDGSCPPGQLKEVTGGNNKQNIPRTRRCVPQPK